MLFFREFVMFVGFLSVQIYNKNMTTPNFFAFTLHLSQKKLPVPAVVLNCGTRTTKLWYSQYQTVVLTVPNCGSHATKLWYSV